MASSNKELDTTADNCETAESAPANSDTNETKSYTLDNLTDLVKAIKFAYPDYGIRKVHREIVEVASSKGNEPALKDVKLNEIKKIWKKLGLSEFHSNASISSATASNRNTTSLTTTNTSDPNTTGINNDNTDSILKFYTVGDGSVKRLALGYEAAAKAAAAAAEAQKLKDQSSSISTNSKWFHFFLDVPADRSGSKPHQALINFSDNNNQNNASMDTFDAGNISNSNGTDAPKKTTDEQVVKIQVAAAIHADSNIKMPMLLYNTDRSARTFIHPPSSSDDDDGGGYNAIYNLISQGGKMGALGKGGGTKGYFRCKIYKEKNVVSIDASSLIMGQTW